MNLERVRELLEGVRSGRVSVEDALRELRGMPFEDLGFAKVDHHRGIRKGFPEVVFCQGKTVEQVAEISRRIVERGADLLATRASREMYEAVREFAPQARYNELARAIVLEQVPKERLKGVVIVSAGTADLPVAEEAAETAWIMGNEVEKVYDVGVAGLHRLLGNLDRLMNANVLVVVAGMEGALASVVGGLVDKPVIAVPTSVGYGASFGGLAALLTMLNSCASGVAVVNIDNGFGAGYIASLINRLAHK
ncbi:nickel pincer cofactor biosynthesis protein LarB [Candidatus Poribacteria bacterium]|nr:MAG: nickel pincer cofactor biosynthesis protein LarB [Candidatus Poribacteria bacterium]